MYQVIIIGSGPAGLTAAVYTARAGLKPLVISGFAAGGQLMLTTDVENFPGFHEGVLGPDLMNKMRQQAERFGTEFIDENVVSVDFSSMPFQVDTNDQGFETKSVIIATGASARWLGLESEERLRGRGVSSCATCDGFFFREKEVILVGGGDSALEEALFLTKFASRVTIIHRRDELRGSKILQKRAFDNPKIDFIWDSVVEEVLGKDVVSGVRLKNIKTDDTSDFQCAGVFIAIGHKPDTEIFEGQVELDDKGYVVVRNGTETSVKGVFAAGDVHDYRYKQAVTAAGDGCKAAIDVEKMLDNIN